MGQRVYVLSQTEYSNILGIFTNIRQCRKYISTLTNQENILLHEIRMNEPQKGKIDMTKLLTIKEADLKNMEKQQTVGSPVKVNEKDVTTLK
jgi:predicted MarR family transcription regulator